MDYQRIGTPVHHFYAWMDLGISISHQTHQEIRLGALKARYTKQSRAATLQCLNQERFMNQPPDSSRSKDTEERFEAFVRSHDEDDAFDENDRLVAEITWEAQDKFYYKQIEAKDAIISLMKEELFTLREDEIPELQKEIERLKEQVGAGEKVLRHSTWKLKPKDQ